MAKKLLTDELWAVIKPLLLPETEKSRGGRPPVRDRDVLRGILFVLSTGLPWEYLPPEIGCGSVMTCWRRLKESLEAGVWHKLHRSLLDSLGQADALTGHAPRWTPQALTQWGGH